MLLHVQQWKHQQLMPPTDNTHEGSISRSLPSSSMPIENTSPPPLWCSIYSNFSQPFNWFGYSPEQYGPSTSFLTTIDSISIFSTYDKQWSLNIGEKQ